MSENQLKFDVFDIEKHSMIVRKSTEFQWLLGNWPKLDNYSELKHFKNSFKIRRISIIVRNQPKLGGLFEKST